jgi:hypothetical protein
MRRLHPEFREAWILRSAPAWSFARFIGCPRTRLSAWMNAAAVSASPLTIERLTMLALLLGYRGSLWR